MNIDEYNKLVNIIEKTLIFKENLKTKLKEAIVYKEKEIKSMTFFELMKRYLAK